MSTSCRPGNDNVFGPIVHGCRSNFDFTLLFEQSILSIPPAAFLLLFTPPRLAKLLQVQNKTFRTPLRSFKIAFALLLTAIQLGLLILWTHHRLTRATVPAAALSFIASVTVLALSPLEHGRDIRPSTILNLYLLVSIVFDVVQARTLYLRHDDPAILGLFTASIGIKLVLLLLEAKDKRGCLQPPYRKTSLETTSGIVFSHTFYWWLKPTLITGFRKVLTLDDLFITDQLSSKRLQHEMQESWDKYASESKYALARAIFHSHRWILLSMIFPRLCLTAFNYAQPFLISSAITYVSQSSPNKNDGYGLIGATFLIYGGIAISTAHFEYARARALSQLRGALTTVIYAKCLETHAGVYDESAALTLISTDITMLQTSLQALCDIWARVIEVAIGIWLLERQLGAVCVAPLVFVLVAFAASVQVTRLIGERRKTWNKAIQRRVGMTSNMLGSMKAIKMTGLSNVLFQSIQTQREREIDLSRKYRTLALWRLDLSYVPIVFGPFAAFVLSAIISGPLSTASTFSSLAIISLLTTPASEFLQSLPLVGIATGGLQRIQAFLLSPAHDDQRLSNETSEVYVLQKGEMELQKWKDSKTYGDIIVDGVCVRPASAAELALQNVSFRASKGSLTMIIGVVGSGKSTLLKTIAGELSYEGSIRTGSKRMAYCAQAPWLQNATVRQIICGYSTTKIDTEWYNKVVHACALDEDILEFPRQDETLIGSRGVVLSGGQKQRLALARAVYFRGDTIILDDVLSALDTRTEGLVVKRLLGKKGMLRELETTIIIATHAVRHLPLADNIIVLDARGHVSEQGSFENLRTKNGFVSKVVMNPDLLESGAAQTSQSNSKTSPMSKILQGPSANDVADRTRRVGDLSVYNYYYSSIGWKLTLLTVVGAGFYTLFSNFPSLLLDWYSGGTISSLATFSTLYALAAVISLLAVTLCIWTLFQRVTPKSGAGLHKILLTSVMRAPQFFFDKTDSGVTLNRFSQDMTLIDASLPSSALVCIINTFQLLTRLGLIAFGANYMALTIPGMLIIIYFLQNFYLKTSRQMRYLDLESKSPLYTHFAETMEGLSTIRSFGWQKAFTQTNIERLDTSQKPAYLLYCIQRWLGLVLDLLVAIMATIVVALATTLTGTTSGGRLGVSLSQMVTISSSLSDLLTAWTMMETCLGAIARLKGFQEETKPEDRPEEGFVPDENWPRGEMEFRNVCASYGSESPALRDVSFKISQGSKIGICGRTGSGKSTLLSILLRILDLDSGAITIDSIDLSTVPREVIRSRLLTIPQEPFILAGSVRMNADPTSIATDEAIIDALTKVKLWDILEARGGLDAEMLSNPLSQGQAQIFCLARAMLRTRGKGSVNRGILVLDEATSNVDAATDQLMQELIREEFKGYTIITVAHRLDTIRDSDWIAVLDGGRLVEWERPHVVLGKQGKSGLGIEKV